MYAAWARTYTMIVLEQHPVRHRFAAFTNGLAISMFRPGRSHYVVCEVANEDTAIDVFGMHILATVRALKHWASRWRRGLRVLRQRRARMVLALTLPQAPEIIAHVLLFVRNHDVQLWHVCRRSLGSCSWPLGAGQGAGAVRGLSASLCARARILGLGCCRRR